jgi:4-deoxy-L-threo-5-hexosulose-uronate ketol-isomerase
MENRDSLYIGRGSEQVEFTSASAEDPAWFYFVSYPAHTAYPTRLVKKDEANRLEMGSMEECNKRVINQSILPGLVDTCQVVMGFTQLEPGSNWNTMPAHTHRRRTEVYMYFDLDEDQCVFHFMGEPDGTRSIVVRNGQAVASPSWSIHSGVGTRNYTFVWAMGGENQDFPDMDHLGIKDLR